MPADRFNRLLVLAIRTAILGSAIPAAPVAFAQQGDTATNTLEEIFVTARHREERLHDVPDSITAFGAETIEDAGITQVADFMKMTPNLFLRKSADGAWTSITMRGISTGQNGWAPVTLVVDGLPTATIAGFDQGTLFDVERIEVLKGPQSALYGAGAIAGAINISTKTPGDELDIDARLEAAEGQDYRFDGAVSGPITESVGLRLAGSFRNSDGVFESTDGDPLNSQDLKALRARLVGEWGNLRLDAVGLWSDITSGTLNSTVALRTTVPSAVRAIVNDFDILPDRSMIGEGDREIREASAKLGWTLPLGKLELLGGYSEDNFNQRGSASFVKTPAAGTFCGPVGGTAAAADCLQDNEDDSKTKSADLRFTSNPDQRARWLLGAAWTERETLNSFYLNDVIDQGGRLVETAPVVLDSTNFRNDSFIGFYGQLSVDLNPRTELTLAGRWDRNRYDSTKYTNRSLTVPVPQPNGAITQESEDSKFQPKVQLSYDWSGDVMSYVTVAKGFRTGYYNSGVHTDPEETTNYEVGLKVLATDGRLQLNSAIYHIDYSQQQFSFITPTPPFRGSTNIPETSIDGGEVELTAITPHGLAVNLALGVTDARVKDGTESPLTPKFTLNMGAQYEHALTDTLSWSARVDFRRQGAYYILTGNQYNIEPKNFLNLRASLKVGDHWTATLFGENVLDEKFATQLAFLPWYTIRQDSGPGRYGIEFRYAL